MMMNRPNRKEHWSLKALDNSTDAPVPLLACRHQEYAL